MWRGRWIHAQMRKPRKRSNSDSASATRMNSPPEGLSPSSSTPSSGSPSPDDAGLLTPSTAGATFTSQAQQSPGQPQAKRRLPPSSSSTFQGREGRESKSRRREHDRDGGRDEESWMSTSGAWMPVRDVQPTYGHIGSTPKLREELLDNAVVDYVRESAY